jgi:hypothetical protein
LPRKSSFFHARKQNTRAGDGFDRDLLWFLFLFGRRKRKPIKEQITLRTVQTVPLKTIEKVSFEKNRKIPMTIMG